MSDKQNNSDEKANVGLLVLLLVGIVQMFAGFSEIGMIVIGFAGIYLFYRITSL